MTRLMTFVLVPSSASATLSRSGFSLLLPHLQMLKVRLWSHSQRSLNDDDDAVFGQNL